NGAQVPPPPNRNGSFEFRVGGAAPAWRLGARASPGATAHRSAGGDCGRGRLALVKPGLPATACGGKGLTKASAPAPVPPSLRRRGGAGSPISTHSFFKRGDMLKKT